MVHGPTETVAAMAKLAPRPDLLVAINGAHHEPPGAPEVVGGVPVVAPGTRGRFLLDVTVAREGGASTVTRYEPIPLAGSQTAKGAMEDKDVVALMLQHRQTVKDAGIRELMAEVEPTPNGEEYVGTSRCIACHPKAGEVWQKSRHGHAWQTFEDVMASGRYPWPVTHYPDCIACHTVGYGQKSGFVNPERTPDLRGVGCEECHGPGGAHVKMPSATPMPTVTVDVCQRCHDFEQSPKFDWDTYWKKIEHGREPEMPPAKK
jgi:hypothetical protein